MAWKVELSALAQKNLDQLDPQIARRILSFLFERVDHLDDPRSIGSIEDGALRILVVKIGTHREVYK